MFNTISVAGTSFAFGPMGRAGKLDSFYYYNTVTFPDLVTGDTTSIEIVPYDVRDIEPQYFAIWIDYDHSNTFDAGELVMQNSNTTKMRLPFFGEPTPPISLTITVPATASLGMTRMRVMRGQKEPRPLDPYTDAYTLNPCHTSVAFAYGCTYDFDVNIVAGAPPPPPPPPPAPKADFASSDTVGTTHTTFTFTDKSTNTPISWYWTFTPGATVSYVSGLANSQNLSVVFTSPGKYTVKLVAGNAGGKDSMVKVNHIAVTLPTGINELSGDKAVLFTPNPAVNGTIQVAAIFNDAALTIHDISGKTMMHVERIDNTLINISSLQAGMYFLSFRKDGETYVRPLQVNP